MRVRLSFLLRPRHLLIYQTPEACSGLTGNRWNRLIPVGYKQRGGVEFVVKRRILQHT